MRNRIATKIGTGTCGLASLALGAFNAGGIEPSDVLFYSKGPLTLRPQLVLSQVYNDNILYSDAQKVDDFLTVTSPGLVLQVGTEEYNYIRLSYFYDRVNYWDQSAFSTDQHRLDLKTNFEKNRWTITGTDQAEFLSSVLGGGVGANLAGVQVDRTTYFLEHRLTYDLGEKTGIYLEPTYSATDFASDLALFDTHTIIGTAGFQYRSTGRLTAFGEVFYGQTRLEPNAMPANTPRADFTGGFLGIRGFFTEKLDGSVKAGLEQREFSDGSPSNLLPIVEASVTQRFTDNAKASLSYSRRQRASVQFLKSEYVADTVALNYQQLFGATGRLRLDLRGSYSQYDYEPSLAYAGITPDGERFDTHINAGVVLTYDFKIWLQGNIGYDYEHFRSDLPLIDDYGVNRITIGLAIGY